MQIIDLSLPIDEKAFEIHKVEIERVSHKDGVEKFNRVIMGKTFKGKIQYLLGKRKLNSVAITPFQGNFLGSLRRPAL